MAASACNIPCRNVMLFLKNLNPSKSGSLRVSHLQFFTKTHSFLIYETTCAVNETLLSRTASSSGTSELQIFSRIVTAVRTDLLAFMSSRAAALRSVRHWQRKAISSCAIEPQVEHEMSRSLAYTICGLRALFVLKRKYIAQGSRCRQIYQWHSYKHRHYCPDPFQFLKRYTEKSAKQYHKYR